MSEKMKVLVLMAFAIVAAAIGEALAAKGLKAIPQESSGFYQHLRAALSNGLVLSGVGLLLVYVALYVSALGMTELSFALPLSAASYLLGVLLSKFYLHEDVKPARWIGTLIIIAGVLVVGIWGQNSGSSNQ